MNMTRDALYFGDQRLVTEQVGHFEFCIPGLTRT